MLTQELMSGIFNVCLLPLLGLLTKFFIDFLKAKRDEAKAKTDNEAAKKYIDMLVDTVSKCVIATNQTYVDALKEQGQFDSVAQQAAFNKTYTAVIDILSSEATQYLKEITGDLNKYIGELIEAEVAKNKKQLAN